MTWTQRLKRVFNIEVTTCVHGGVAARIVASVEDPTAIRAILDHFDKHGALEHTHYRPRPRPRNRKIVHAHPNCENQYRARCDDDPAGPRSARCRESVRNGCALRGNAPASCRNPAREHLIRAQTGACAATSYSPDCSKRAFEFPIL